ncbi:hypothetical protein MVEN_00002700 [Mycena venus]|uniref:MULE transposase domain-containing protein n=1 Tax=Mycena venus TaxID=2733690 RepID=A0A8H6Z7Z6_9AGAR|nr:hypothetical protein MVEN_00002700 [Mycena venus]
MSQSMFRALIPPADPQGNIKSAKRTACRASGLLPSRAIRPPSFTFKSFAPSPASTSYAKCGSYQYDLESGKYPLTWPSLDHMKVWLRKEEDAQGVSFLLKEAEPNGGKGVHQWTTKHIYVCSRVGTGGKSKYVPNHPEREREIGNKRMDCSCGVVGKSYPGGATILGKYDNSHSHPIGAENLIYTRIPPEVRYKIEQDLRDGIRPDIVLARARGNVHTEQNLPHLASHAPRPEEFIKAKGVPRIQKKIEAGTIHLDAQDGRSTLQWVEHLEAIRALMYFKSSSDPPPPDSEMLLFTFIVRDRYGRGMPIAWLISSNGKGDTIDYFLKNLRARNPDILPSKLMSDNDSAQLGKYRFRYPESLLLLCWWHVLHAWQKHFVITHFAELWDKLKGWIRITDPDKFWTCWEEIKALAPDSVIEYLEEYYMGETTLKMWSAMYRKDRTIFELCDTNMLVEAWHHILKTHNMEGKRNRRVNQLIHTLINVALLNYIANHRAQQFRIPWPRSRASEAKSN